MPLYEFYCNSCNRRVTLFMKISEYNANVTCPTCNQKNLTRIISKVSIHSTYTPGEINESNPDYYKDPRNIGRRMEKRFQELNIDMPSEVKKNLEKAREGVLPDSLKDLGSAAPDSSYH